MKKKLQIGDRVKHANFKWLTCAGTVTGIVGQLNMPTLTAGVIPLSQYVTVKWDDPEHGETSSDGIRAGSLRKI